jgi:hypothetical protein
MTSLLRSAALLFTLILNSSSIFAGQWVEVPGGALNNGGLYGIAVVSANNAWAVGGSGGADRAVIEHWDGTNWSVAVVLPRDTDLSAMAALSSSDVWAVGQNGVHSLVERWNGQRWLMVPTPSVGTYDLLTAICAILHDDAWAVGYSIPYLYTLMHWDGRSWAVVNGSPANLSILNSVKAFACDDVWAVGEKDVHQGTSSTFTLHWDGTTWTEIPSPNVATGNSLNGVDGSGPEDVWAVGSSSLGALTMHWDGTAWTVVPTPVDNGWFTAVKAFSATNVCAVGSLAGTSGQEPLSARWDGTQWRVMPTPPVNIPAFLSAISARDGSIWVVGPKAQTGNGLI